MIKELAFSEEELEWLVKERNIPIAFDEDCPETTPDEISACESVQRLYREEGTKR